MATEKAPNGEEGRYGELKKIISTKGRKTTHAMGHTSI
jgi:hypothetical protein